MNDLDVKPEDRPASSAEVRELIATNREVVTLLSTVSDKIDAAVENVGPVIDKLQSHPMFKMFAGGR